MSSYRVSSLRLTAKNALLGAIEAIPAERKIVLLDHTTVKVVDAICTLNDILDVGVYLVETVEKKRQPYPTMDAVYFIAPEQGNQSSSSVVSKDFAEKLPTYKSIHLFFTNEVPQSLFQMLATSPAGPFVKTFQEVFLEYVPFEARAFHLNMADSFGRLLQSGAEKVPGNIAELEVIAQKLVSLIVSLNELPTIKYRNLGGVSPDREGKLSARLANLVQEGIDHYSSRNPNFKPVQGGDFIILDRTIDLVSPLLHEFTYQAMAHDLLSIHHDNRYDYKFASGVRGESSMRTVALDENDSLWVSMRHTHIADCSKFIVNNFNQFISENKAAVKQSSKSKTTGTTTTTASAAADANVSSLAEMKEAINALGEFQELKSQYSLHFTIAEECLAVFNKKKLVEIAGVEQNMVMGVDPEGKPIKDIWKQLVPLLNRDNLNSQDRVRLIMIYLLTQPPLNDADRRSMLDHAKLDSTDMESLRRLMLLCGDTNVMAPKLKKKIEEFTYEVSRYAPRVKSIMQDSISGVLDSAYVPVKGSVSSNAAISGTSSGVKSAPVSLRQKTAPSSFSGVNSAAAMTSASSVPSRSVTLFVIGGITYSEIRAAYEVSNSTKREVYIGAINRFLTWMKDLSEFITEDDLAFEEDLLVNSYDIKTWHRYIESKRTWLLAQGVHVTDPVGCKKISFIYERVLKLLPGSFKLWKEYLDLLQEGAAGVNEEIIIGAFEHSLLTLHRMPRIWLDYLTFLARKQRLPLIRPVFNRALQSLPITQHPRLWEFIFTKLVGRFGKILPNWSKSFWERYLQIAPEKRGEYIRFLKKIGDWDTAAKELLLLSNSLMKSSNDLLAVSKETTRTRNVRPKEVTEEEEEAEANKDSDSEDEYEVSDDVKKCWEALCRLVIDHSNEIKSVSVESILRNAIFVFKRDQGRYWTALATYHIKRGFFDSARVVFEEAMEKVFLVRDFAQIFDSYAKMEETLLAVIIEEEDSKRKLKAKPAKKTKNTKKSSSEEESSVSKDILCQLINLESLLKRHPFLLNDVNLRKNPHSVSDWLNRTKLVFSQSGGNLNIVIEAFEDALKTINPRKAGSEYPKIWIELASFLESNDAKDLARQVFKRATEWGEINYSSSEDIAAVLIAFAEFEFRNEDIQGGIDLIASAVTPAKKKTGNESWDKLFKCLTLWNFMIDAEEARGATSACESAYERLLQFKLAQPQHVINYALFREEVLADLDGAFKIYERGIELFQYPIAFDIWNIYLPKFVKKYASVRLERTRDLFECALQGCPDRFAIHLYLMYGKVEEEFGLIRNALEIYRRGCNSVVLSDRPTLFTLLISKTLESQGAIAVRALYEEAIRSLPFPHSLPFALAHSGLEEKLREMPRARALFLHMSQFCDPRAYEDSFWKLWLEFETRNGDESSFREMLRVKRSVSALFIQRTPFVKATTVVESPAVINDSVVENEEEIQLEI